MAQGSRACTPVELCENNFQTSLYGSFCHLVCFLALVRRSCIELQILEDPVLSVGRLKKTNSKDSSDDTRSRTSSVSKAKGRPGPKSTKARPGPASSRSSKRSATPDNTNGDDDGSDDDDSDGDPFQANDEEDPLDVTPRKQK